MADAPAYFPFYPNDFASDDKVEAMSTLAVGAYTLLLCKAWQNGGTLPDDDARLAKWARVTANAWEKIKPQVTAAFQMADGVWVQGRMTREYAKATSAIARKSDGGRRGAAKRHGIPRGIPSGIPTGIDSGIPAVRGSGSDSGSGSLTEISDSAACESQPPREIRLMTAEVRPLWESYPPSKRGGIGGFQRALQGAVGTVGGSKEYALAWLHGRIRAYAKSDVGRGEFAVHANRFFDEQVYVCPDTDWMDQAKREAGIRAETPEDKARRLAAAKAREEREEAERVADQQRRVAAWEAEKKARTA